MYPRDRNVLRSADKYNEHTVYAEKTNKKHLYFISEFSTQLKCI